jgi:uncharacterized protein YdbL (DUF1318 family)
MANFFQTSPLEGDPKTQNNLGLRGIATIESEMNALSASFSSQHFSKGSSQTFSSGKAKSQEREPVIPDKIRSGEDLRTYLCVMNLPNKYTHAELVGEINETHQHKYSDIKLPKAKDNERNNPGFFFIDMRHPLYVLDFHSLYQNRQWRQHKSGKRAEIYYGYKKHYSKKSSKHKTHSTESFKSLDELEFKDL